MEEQDIRWEQRFSNYKKALSKLEEAVTRIDQDYPLDNEGNIDEDDFLDDIIKEGLIQRFEYTHELAWKVMKDYLKDVGEVKTIGSKDATREALTADLITDGEIWIEMILSRNQTSHIYNEHTANDIFTKVIKEYFPEFVAFRDTMERRRFGKQGDLFEER